MEYSKLSKRELVGMIELMNKVLAGELNFEDDNSKKVQEENPLENLIGTIPFLLTNRKLFEENQDIADFASRLNIMIPSPEKKKREDIIGRIIFAISNFDRDKIRELNVLIKNVKQNNIEKSGPSNFFQVGIR